MITKLYNFIKENIKFFIALVLIIVLFKFELPYYIDAPGGLLNVKDRVYVEDSYNISGSLNLAYVKEIKATIPTLIIAYFNNDWNIVKKSDVIASNETMKENEFRNKILLNESKSNAIIAGFNSALKEYEIRNRELYVIYVEENAITDLKIGDQILSINNKSIVSKAEALDIINKNEDLNIEVINEGKKYIRSAKKQDGIIGILVSELKDVETSKKVSFKFKDSESGPSGGFMMALSIYDYLTKEDLTKNLKIVGTGTIEEDGSVGKIGGIEYKLKAAEKAKAKIFFVPIDNYDEAIKVKNNEKLDIILVSVSNLSDAIKYLEKL